MIITVINRLIMSKQPRVALSTSAAGAAVGEGGRYHAVVLENDMKYEGMSLEV